MRKCKIDEKLAKQLMTWIREKDWNKAKQTMPDEKNACT
jgi:hypothetical protein